MKAYQQNLDKLAAADTQVLGVSMDSTFANKAWAQQIGVTFPLLSDWGGQVTRQYGIFDPKYKAARRVTYLINPQGKIIHMQTDEQAIDPSDTVAACQRQKLKQ
jgi:peroxiredoxin